MNDHKPPVLLMLPLPPFSCPPGGRDIMGFAVELMTCVIRSERVTRLSQSEERRQFHELLLLSFFLPPRKKIPVPGKTPNALSILFDVSAVFLPNELRCSNGARRKARDLGNIRILGELL